MVWLLTVCSGLPLPSWKQEELWDETRMSWDAKRVSCVLSVVRIVISVLTSLPSE